MPVKFLRASLAFLFSVSLMSITFSPANAVEVVTAPQINYTDASGLNFAAVPTKWSAATKSTFQWLVNGKAVAGATKTAFKAAAKQKNQSIQLKETSSDKKVSLSVIGKIGQVIVNVKPVVAFTDESKTLVKVVAGQVSPKTAKASYQWYKGAIDISGAKLNTYNPATEDQGSRVYVNVKYESKGFAENAVDSNEIEIPAVQRIYKEIWREEFNGAVGSAPDSNTWTSENGDGSKSAAGGGWGNRERQSYIPELAKITADGALQIDATTVGANDYNCYYKAPCEWISAKYITKDKVGFKYGRIEARIKGPVGKGTWGAFWMLGADIDKRVWPWCGEIDVTELVGKDPNLNYGYLHGLLSGGYGGRGKTVEMPNGFANEFHTYAIDWLPDRVDWYVDDVFFGSQQKRDKDWVFDHEFYLIMNLAMGGNLGGPIESGLNKASISFDWIRFSTINGIGEVIKH